MQSITAIINAKGRIHDDDSGDLFGGHEEEAYSFSKNIKLDTGGFSKTFEDSKTVDGEVKLVMLLKLQALDNEDLIVSGTLELWEGPSWNKGGSEALDVTVIKPGKTKTVYDGKLKDDEGDWASVKLEIKNSPNQNSAETSLLHARNTAQAIESISDKNELLAIARKCLEAIS